MYIQIHPLTNVYKVSSHCVRVYIHVCVYVYVYIVCIYFIAFHKFALRLSSVDGCDADIFGNSSIASSLRTWTCHVLHSVVVRNAFQMYLHSLRECAYACLMCIFLSFFFFFYSVSVRRDACTLTVTFLSGNHFNFENIQYRILGIQLVLTLGF